MIDSFGQFWHINKTLPLHTCQNFLRRAGMEWQGYSPASFYEMMKRGAPVLRYASPALQENKTLVCFLVWSNPTNLCWASPALQADSDVVSAALCSPFYDQFPPPVPVTCVLRLADESFRADKDAVMLALARSGYEFEFASEALRADAYVAAWAGAPIGSFSSRRLSKKFMCTLKSGVSVSHVSTFLESIVQDVDCKNYFSTVYSHWRDPRRTVDKKQDCETILQRMSQRCPLCFRVSPDARELLWPTREEWDGVF